MDKMKLKDTIEFMISDDYKERFKSEYYQTKIRYKKLHRIIIKSQTGTLDFELSCSPEILEKQAYYMGNYLKYLEIRAEIEKIEL